MRCFCTVAPPAQVHPSVSRVSIPSPSRTTVCSRSINSPVRRDCVSRKCASLLQSGSRCPWPSEGAVVRSRHHTISRVAVESTPAPALGPAGLRVPVFVTTSGSKSGVKGCETSPGCVSLPKGRSFPGSELPRASWEWGVGVQRAPANSYGGPCRGGGEGDAEPSPSEPRNWPARSQLPLRASRRGPGKESRLPWALVAPQPGQHNVWSLHSHTLSP